MVAKDILEHINPYLPETLNLKCVDFISKCAVRAYVTGRLTEKETFKIFCDVQKGNME